MKGKPTSTLDRITVWSLITTDQPQREGKTSSNVSLDLLWQWNTDSEFMRYSCISLKARVDYRLLFFLNGLQKTTRHFSNVIGLTYEPNAIMEVYLWMERCPPGWTVVCPRHWEGYWGWSFPECSLQHFLFLTLPGLLPAVWGSF